MKRALLLLFLLLMLVVAPAQAQVSVTLVPTPKVQWLDLNGDPLAAGHVHAYISGTTTNQATYTDSTGAVANANPVVLDAAGRAEIWLEDGLVYTLALHDSSNALVWSVDGVSAGDLETALVVGTTAVTFTSTPTFDSSTASYFSMTLTGNVTSSTISNASDGRVLYFNICQDATGSRTFTWPATVLTPPIVGSGASVCTSASFIYDGTNWRELAARSVGLYAETPAGIQAAIDAAEADGGGIVQLPLGVISGDFSLTINEPVCLIGHGTDTNSAGAGATVLRHTGTGGTVIKISTNAARSACLRDFTIDNTGTGAIAIEVSGTLETLIERVTVWPSTGFTTAALQLGNSTDRAAGVWIYEFYARDNTVGVLAIDTIAPIFVNSILIDNTTGLILGETGGDFATGLKYIGGSIESRTAGQTSVQFIRGRNIYFNTFFECIDNPCVDITSANGAQTALNVGFEFNWFSGDGTTDRAIDINLAGATVTIGPNIWNNFDAAKEVINDASFTSIVVLGEQEFITTTPGLFATGTNVSIYDLNPTIDGPIALQGDGAINSTTQLDLNAQDATNGVRVNRNGLTDAPFVVKESGTNTDNFKVEGDSVGDAILRGSFDPLEGKVSNFPRWILKVVDHTDMTAAATADDFVLWTLPANTMIHDVVGTVVTAWEAAVGLSAAVCSVGTAAGSANDLTLDDDFFAIATVYELHDATASGGKGALLFDSTDKFAPFMLVASGDIEIQCDLTGDDHADTNAGQARIYILVSQPLGNTTTEAN